MWVLLSFVGMHYFLSHPQERRRVRAGVDGTWSGKKKKKEKEREGTEKGEE